MNTACDTETCETCGTDALEGLNADGDCLACERGSLDRLLRSMAAGVTRDPATGRFVQINLKG
jgi:hypothetical protein